LSENISRESIVSLIEAALRGGAVALLVLIAVLLLRAAFRQPFSRPVGNLRSICLLREPLLRGYAASRSRRS
jgi:hypothetical protein